MGWSNRLNTLASRDTRPAAMIKPTCDSKKQTAHFLHTVLHECYTAEQLLHLFAASQQHSASARTLMLGILVKACNDW
jgi:hypothetical protein